MKSLCAITRTIIMAVAAILLATGCSKQTAQHPVLVKPNAEVAKICKGMSREDVESAIGSPRRKDEKESFYKDKGMSIRFDTNGVVLNVKCIMGFKGVTKEGIGIGSTRKEVIAAYGKPDEDKHYGDGEDLWYASASINYWVQRGKVTSFIVHF